MNKEERQKNGKMPKTFQKKLILYNMLVIICIASAVSFYNYRSYCQDVIISETNNSANRVRTLSERLQVAYDEMVNIVLNCAERKTLFFATTLDSPNKPYNTSMTLYASDVLRDFCAISGYSRYINKIVLYHNGLVLQAGNSFGASMDVENIMKAPWFSSLLYRENAQYTLSLEDNPFKSGKGRPTVPKLLPLLRPLQYSARNKPEESWVFLGIAPTLFSDTLKSLPPDVLVYAVTEGGDIIASTDKEQEFDTTPIITSLLASEEQEGNYQMKLHHEKCVITYTKQPVSGLLFFEIRPESRMQLDHGVIRRTVLIIFFFCIAIGLTLSLLISRQLGAPISRLTKRLELISKGDFEPDHSIETDDEIGMIGRQINQMSGRIANLLETRVESEKEKKDLEIKMLQAQINPHFLYNTLDSIKWIATMQKNSGIVSVVTALSSLLKNMAKGFNEKVTLRQELDFLQNYVIIEKIRYIELFDIDIIVDQEELYDARIIKLTLQPIVENAIFSGIEPSGRTGLITIRVWVKAGVLHISVTDNGIGISPENIEKLLTDTSRITRSNMSGIGLPNVDRRFKLVYGEDYGLTIESVVDQYTTITITLPLEF